MSTHAYLDLSNRANIGDRADDPVHHARASTGVDP
jgi:hypothetical protein